MQKYTVKNLLEENGKTFALSLLSGGKGIDCPIKSFKINRLGLALTGYFEYFPEEEIQIYGMR